MERTFFDGRHSPATRLQSNAFYEKKGEIISGLDYCSGQPMGKSM